MSNVQGRGDLTRGEGGGKEEGGGGKDGEGVEGGAQSSMDGKCAGTGLGKEGAMPYVGLVCGNDLGFASDYDFDFTIFFDR